MAVYFDQSSSAFNCAPAGSADMDSCPPVARAPFSFGAHWKACGDYASLSVASSDLVVARKIINFILWPLRVFIFVVTLFVAMPLHFFRPHEQNKGSLSEISFDQSSSVECLQDDSGSMFRTARLSISSDTEALQSDTTESCHLLVNSSIDTVVDDVVNEDTIAEDTIAEDTIASLKQYIGDCRAKLTAEDTTLQEAVRLKYDIARSQREILSTQNVTGL